MKDYRRPVDYHNERLQESELRPVSRPPTYSSGAPVYNPHATGELQQVKNVGGRGSFSLNPRPH